MLLVITAKLRYGGDKVDRSLYELVAAMEGARTAPAADTPPVARRTSPGLPPRPPIPAPPPKRGSHVE